VEPGPGEAVAGGNEPGLKCTDQRGTGDPAADVSVPGAGCCGQALRGIGCGAGYGLPETG